MSARAHGKPWAVALGQAIGMVRALKQISLREHAKFLGVPISTLSRIERGHGCDTDMLVRIHQRTGVPYDVLLGSNKLTHSADGQ